MKLEDLKVGLVVQLKVRLFKMSGNSLTAKVIDIKEGVATLKVEYLGVHITTLSVRRDSEGNLVWGE